MTQDPHRALVERYLAAYNAFDIPGMLETLTPDIAFENVAGGAVTSRVSGRDEFRVLAEQAAALFARREQRITGYDVAGETAVVGIAYEGVLAASLPPGLPPIFEPGGTLRLDGRSTFHFRDGRIARIVDES